MENENKNTESQQTETPAQTEQPSAVSFAELKEKVAAPKLPEVAPPEVMAKLNLDPEVAEVVKVVQKTTDPAIRNALMMTPGVKEALAVLKKVQEDMTSVSEQPQTAEEKPTPVEMTPEEIAAYEEQQAAEEVVQPPAQAAPVEQVSTDGQPKPKAAKKTAKKTAKSKTDGHAKAAKAAKKTVAKKAAKAESKQGSGWAQSAGSIKISLSDLNANERKLLKTISGITEEIQPKRITQLAEEAFPDEDPKKANSWTRNSLRRLVRGKLVEKVGRGSYRISGKGWKEVFTSAFGNANHAAAANA